MRLFVTQGSGGFNRTADQGYVKEAQATTEINVAGTNYMDTSETHRTNDANTKTLSQNFWND